MKIKFTNSIKSIVVVLLLVVISCKENTKEDKVNPIIKVYEPTWESLKTIPVPEWYEDAKFGIMVHWGPYAKLGEISDGVGFNYIEHMSSDMYRSNMTDSILKKAFGKTIPEFGYKDLVPMLTGENFDAEAWLDLFVKAGAKYIIPVAEHHDGFAMWDSELTEWDAMDKGPKRDVIGELAVATRKRGLKFAPSFHRERHNTFFSVVKNEGGSALPMIKEEIKRMPEAAGLYGPFEMTDVYMKDFAARWKEICDKYQPDFYWLDDYPDYNEATRSLFMRYQRQIIADYINTANQEWGKEVYFNNKGKNNNYPDGVGIREYDNMQSDDISVKFQNPATTGVSYGYRKREEEQEGWIKPPRELIHLLVEVVSKNGNLLMNVGPRPDGTITQWQQEALLAIGDWLDVNGEAIYGTRVWKVAGEDRMRFTVKGNILYTTLLDWPEDKKLLIKTLKPWNVQNVQSVSMIGGNNLDFEMTDEGLQIVLPKEVIGKYAHPIKIVCSQDVQTMSYKKTEIITEDLHLKHKKRIMSLEEAVQEKSSTDFD